MDLQTRISHLGGPTASPSLCQAGSRAWLVALTGVLSTLILLTILVAPARAQDGPEVGVGDGTVRVGEEVFTGDGCVRAGDVAVGDCGEDSGKDTGKDEDATGGNTETPEEASDRPQDAGGETTTGEEPSAEEDTSGTNGMAGSGKPDEITDGTTIMATTDQALDQTTRKALPGSETTGPEGTGSTVAGEPAVCPAAPPEDAKAAIVARAVDGDTVGLQEPVDGYDRVRLIGMDTPELDGKDAGPEPGAEEAKAFTAESLEGKEVTLETDEEVEDPYGRMLAYVWIPADAKADAKADTNRPELFNRTLIADGYAETMTVEPNDAYAECLAAAENKPKDGAPNTTGGTTRDGEGNGDENEGLLGRLRNLISSEEPPGGQTAAKEDQYGQDGTTPGITPGGTTDGPMPAETVPEEGFQGDTLQEDTALEPTTGGETYGETDGATRDQTSQEDNPPPATGGTDGFRELQEPNIQEPEAQEPEVQGPPARSGELGTGSELADPAPDDPAPDDPASGELAASQPPPPSGTDTELDTGTDTPTDTGSVADQTQLITLPETSGVPLTHLAALPAGVALICSGLFAALVRGPQETRCNGSGG